MRDLVAAVSAGDDRAFELLFVRYQRRIAAYVGGMVHDHARAEDITQDVFMSALRRMRATEQPDRLQAVDLRDRQERVHRRVPALAQPPGGLLRRRRRARRRRSGRRPPAARPTPPSTRKLAIDDLCGAFGGLSQAHHDILVMREFEGLCYREIGERLG